MNTLKSIMWSTVVLAVFGFIAVWWIENKINQFTTTVSDSVSAVSDSMSAPFEAAADSFEGVQKWTDETNDSINEFMEQSEQGRAINKAVVDFAKFLSGE